jgi:hypothetical protein
LLVAGSRGAVLLAVNFCGGDAHTLPRFMRAAKICGGAKTRARVSKIERFGKQPVSTRRRGELPRPGCLAFPFFGIFDLDQGEDRVVTYLI